MSNQTPKTPVLFISIDIETDGPAPGLNSMLALGAAAYAEDGHEVGGWYCTLEPLPGAERNPETMLWWMQDEQREAWREVNDSPAPPDKAIRNFVAWLEEDLSGHKHIAIGWPIAFDFAFVNYYCHRFAGRNPLGFAGLDIRSFANGLANYDSYYGLPESDVWRMAGQIDTAGLRKHHALDDAIAQGRLFKALRRETLRRRELAGDGTVNAGAAAELKHKTREDVIHELAIMKPEDRARILSIYRHPTKN